MPTQFGGRGLNLAQVCQEQRRQASRAPATALAFANIYVGIAQRAIELAVASLKRRTSIGEELRW